MAIKKHEADGAEEQDLAGHAPDRATAFQCRQGDVYLIDESGPEWRTDSHYKPVSGSDAKLIPYESHADSKFAVLAHGETTGHMHAVDSVAADYFAANGLELLAMKRESKLKHGNPLQAFMDEDHGSIELPGTTLVVRKQREYTPQGYRPVVD